MKRFILAVAVFPLFSFAAYAADLPNTKEPAVFPPPQPILTWTGCYIDGGGGYGMYNIDSHSETSLGLVPIGTTVTNGGRGWLGRLGGGCDYRFGLGSLGNFVVGAFADYDFTSLNGTFGDPSGPVQGSETERGAWHAGARLGYLVTPSLLTYVDGGYTQTRFGAVNFFGVLAPAAAATGLTLSGNTYSGWFIGGGTEFALNMPWIPIRGLFWRAEYRFAQYQSVNVPIVITATGAPFGVSEHISPYVQTITTSLVWRFNFDGPPIAARY